MAHLLLRSCPCYYRDNDNRLNEIHQFEQNYDSHLTIDWYWKTKFLSYLLDNTSRTQNFHFCLIIISFIIYDIQQLIQLNASTLFNIENKQMCYRAQNLNIDDLYRLRMNFNSIISINRSFDFCKTTDKAIDEISSTSNTLETLLYRFSINHSYLPISDNKVLSSIGTLFYIQYIAMETDGM